jgi:hypothetical protein
LAGTSIPCKKAHPTHMYTVLWPHFTAKFPAQHQGFPHFDQAVLMQPRHKKALCQLHITLAVLEADPTIFGPKDALLPQIFEPREEDYTHGNWASVFVRTW